MFFVLIERVASVDATLFNFSGPNVVVKYSRRVAARPDGKSLNRIAAVRHSKDTQDRLSEIFYNEMHHHRKHHTCPIALHPAVFLAWLAVPFSVLDVVPSSCGVSSSLPSLSLTPLACRSMSLALS